MKRSPRAEYWARPATDRAGAQGERGTRCVVLIGVAADPLSGHAAKGKTMGVLLIIMFAILGLGLRANAASRRARVAGSEGSEETAAIIDSYARTSLLVLLCLLGLLALGLTYGNVLGASAR